MHIGRVSVRLTPSVAGVGYVATGTQGGGSPSPHTYFPRIMKRLHEKADAQLQGYQPNVVVIDLTNDTANLAPLRIDAVWNAYSPAFDLTKMPSRVDGAVSMWQDAF